MAASDNSRGDIDPSEIVASFEVYVGSPDRDADRYLVRFLQEFDSLYQEPSQSVREEEEGGIAQEVRRIVKAHIPEGVDVRRVRIRYGDSATLTFLLVLNGALALYEFVSKYDDLRKSLDRIAEDVRTLLTSIGRWWHGRLHPGPAPWGPVTSRASWKPGPGVREFLSNPLASPQAATVSAAQAWRTVAIFLLALNVLLIVALVMLIWTPISRFYDHAQLPAHSASPTWQPAPGNTP